MIHTDAVIPVYNFRTCSGGTDFAIAHIDSVDVLGSLQIPHRQEGYNVSLLLKGKLTRYIDFERFEIQAPAIICVGPEQINQYESADDAEMICLSFTQDFLITEMKRWVACWECMFTKVIMNADEKDMEELRVYADLMLKEFAADKPKKEMIIRNLLNAFIITVARMRDSLASVMMLDMNTNKLVEQFKSFVDLQFKEKTQVAQYAEMLAVTPGHLNDVIKSTTGRTAKQIIDEKRIMEAKRLLFWADHNLKEIAGQLSFEDDSYFNRYFKKHTGFTPSTFQRTIREKYN
jgi:AraC-like DNA-binding protein